MAEAFTGMIMTVTGPSAPKDVLTMGQIGVMELTGPLLAEPDLPSLRADKPGRQQNGTGFGKESDAVWVEAALL